MLLPSLSRLLHLSPPPDGRLTADVTVIEPRRTAPRALLREVVRYRHLLRYFAMATLRRTYRATVLGWVWLLIRPIVPVVVSTLIFHQLAGIQAGPVPYGLFFLVGMTVWSLLDDGSMWATRSLQIHRGLLTKFYFPRIILPVAAMAPGIFNFLIHLGLVLVFSLYFLTSEGKFYLAAGAHSWLAVVAVVLSLGLAIGIGFFTSVLGGEMRDVRFTLRYILQFWFFLTPIAYPLSLVPDQLRWMAAINPMTTAVELFRWGLFGLPSGLRPPEIGLALLIWTVLFAWGLWFFNRAETEAVDRL